MANDGIPAARKDTLVLELLSVLDEARAPLKRSEALGRVEERLRGTFTPIELTPAGPSTEEARWHNHLSWYSTHMRVAGWLDKTGACLL
ncbi:MAG: winged helix-turn-helix domain-containing protein [Actinomyces sp.]|jgi:hypothetical protein|nr:winged helix-turn-helix domain-containing protein [Actinomyces sp.]MCI1641451.1 winged helix-turn-helix domain-containing protein [Actinomyces sp.]MCI1661805.1 winged helix-turn-helix domain-containing protein [Actinomyces sp.]MCI1690553.1 winged helix-turn-helix domain-containing protein [Actinomyces sp.]MCI1786534.1 winged helix-turn-helix domain-containing protein [Actinomyces sp.]MCI1829945.1 winged helix-turn-helix domain-containing protein [Actinomyces sp.]